MDWAVFLRQLRADASHRRQVLPASATSLLVCNVCLRGLWRPLEAQHAPRSSMTDRSKRDGMNRGFGQRCAGGGVRAQSVLASGAGPFPFCFRFPRSRLGRDRAMSLHLQLYKIVITLIMHLPKALYFQMTDLKLRSILVRVRLYSCPHRAHSTQEPSCVDRTGPLRLTYVQGTIQQNNATKRPAPPAPTRPARRRTETVANPKHATPPAHETLHGMSSMASRHDDTIDTIVQLKVRSVSAKLPTKRTLHADAHNGCEIESLLCVESWRMHARSPLRFTHAALRTPPRSCLAGRTSPRGCNAFM